MLDKVKCSIGEALSLCIKEFGWDARVKDHALEPLQGGEKISVPYRFNKEIEHSIIGKL